MTLFIINIALEDREYRDCLLVSRGMTNVIKSGSIQENGDMNDKTEERREKHMLGNLGPPVRLLQTFLGVLGGFLAVKIPYFFADVC